MKTKLFGKSSILRGLLSLFFLVAMVENAWGEDATMTAGTNGSSATVNSKTAIKVGTSKAGGTMTITVPAGATSLDLYAAAWNGVTGLSLNITPTANVSTTSIALTADAGISGNSPFTLSGDEADYKFTIPLNNITSQTTLTFTSSTTKRFVVWGATYTSGAADTRTAVNMSNFTTAGGVTSIVKGNTLATSVTNDQSGWTAAYTYSSDKESVATVAADGTITAVAKGTAKITAKLNVSASDASYKAGTTTSKSIDITVTNPTHHYTFSANGTTFSEGDVEEGSAITFPTTKPEDVNNMKFVGWYAGDYNNATTAPTYVSSATMGQNDVTYKAVYATESGSTAQTLTKEFTYSSTDWTVSGCSDNTNGKFYILKTGGSITSPSFDVSQIQSIVASMRTYGGTSYKTVNIKCGNTSVGTLTATNGGTMASATAVLQSGLSLSGNNTLVFTPASGSSTTSNGPGIQSITITYKVGGTTYSDFTTSVVTKTLTGISFGGSLTKTVYTEEETFDPAGITVLASFQDQAEKEDVTSKATITYSKDPLTVGTTQVQVSASWKGQNCQDNYSITVNAIPTYSITASAATGGTYTVKIGDAEAANVPAEGTTYQSRAEKTITLTSAASEGYKLHSTPFVVKDADNAEVKVSKDGDNYTFTMPAKAVTITAQYVQQFTIATTTPEHGAIASIKDNDGNDITATSKGSKVWVTVTPDTHYTLSAISVKKADESVVAVTVDPENANRASFSMPQSNVTVSATFAEDPKHNVTFSVNGVANDPTVVYEGEAVVFPSAPAAPAGYAFRGWAAAAIAGSQAEAPSFISNATMESSDLTYYAVFAVVTPGDDAMVDFTINSITGLTTGANQRTQTAGGITFAFSSVMDVNSSGTHYVQLSKSSTMTQDAPFSGSIKKISFEKFGFSSTSDASMVVSGKNGVDGDYATVQSCTGTYTGTDIDFSTNNYNMFKIEVGSERTMKFSKMTVTYSSVSYSDYCTVTTPIAVYPTTIFAAKSATIKTVDAAGKKNTYKQAVSTNSTGSITYESSDTGIATVANDGTVTVVKAGTVDITANVAAVTGEWKASSASYTLTITKVSPNLAFSQGSMQVYAENEYTINATADSDGKISYKFSNAKASRNEQGKVVIAAYTTSPYSVNLSAQIEATDIYTAVTNTTTAKIQLNIQDNRKTQDISFENASYSTPKGTVLANFTNTLSGAKTAVKYTSDNTAVAEVNETTGEVTVHENVKGEATITATAENALVLEDGVYYRYAEKTATFKIVVTASYAAPTFNLTGGEIKATQQLTISADNPYVIYYTTDGSTPSYDISSMESHGTEYHSGNIAINGTMTVKAIAVNQDLDEVSNTAEILFTAVKPAAPTFSWEDGDKIQVGNSITLSTTEDAKIAYTITKNGDEIASTLDAASPAEYTFTAAGTYTVETFTTWNLEGGFSSDAVSQTIAVFGPASIPFAYNGNGSNLPNYFTKIGTVENYSAENTSIALKGQDRGIELWVGDGAYVLSFNIKQNGDWNDANIFTVSTSTNGKDYKVLTTYNSSNPLTKDTELENVTFDLPINTHYIKWYYTARTSGNIGIGNIKVTKKTPTLAFAAPEYWVSKGATIVTPQPVVETDGEVSYNASGDAAALNSNNKIELKGTLGDVTITANAAAGASYGPTSASYVLHVVAPEQVSVSAARWATFAPSLAVELPAGVYDESPSVRVYHIATNTVNDGTIEFTKTQETITAGKTIAAGTGILVKANEGTVTFPVNTTVAPTELTGNQLVGVLTSTDRPGNNAYIFKNGSKGIGFYPWVSGSLSAGKAYLQLTETQGAGEVRFLGLPEDDDNATALEIVYAHNDEDNAFNLFGQKVDTRNYKGMVVKNGAKYIVK